MNSIIRTAVIALATAVCCVRAEAAEKLSMAIPQIATSFAYAYAAREKGYFIEEGLDVDLEVAGGEPATSALIAGSIDYSSSTSSAMSAILKGAMLKVIMVGQNRPPYQLWSFDPAVTRFEDLKGKIIAIRIRGATDELALRILLNEKGLPSNFFGYTPLGYGPVFIAAVSAGSQPFVTLTRPDIEQLQSAGLLGKGKMVYDIAKQVQMTLGGLVATEKTLSAKPEQTRKLLRALWKGTIYMLTERRGTIAMMEKILPKMSPEALTNDYVGTVEDADKGGVISLDAARRELSVRGELLGVPQDKILPPEKIYDFSLIEGVIKELDTAHWRPTN